MKKILQLTILLLGLTLFAGLNQAHAQPQVDIQIFIDGQQLALDTAVQIQNDSIILPFRAVADALGIEVVWDPAGRRIMAQDGKTSLEMTIDSNIAKVNDKISIMAAAPVIFQGRTLLPARFFSETFGCQVDWDPQGRIVSILTTPADFKVLGFYALGDEKTSSWGDLFMAPYPETSAGRTGIITDLALGWYSLQEDGELLRDSSSGWRVPGGWEEVLQAAQKYGLKTQMVIHMTDNGGQLTRFLQDQQAIGRSIKSMVSEARLYQGINLDFEGLGWNESGEELDSTRKAFTAFAAALSRELKSRGLELTLTLHAPNSSYPGYDYPELGRLADQIIIMAYDYGPRPEPEQLVAAAAAQARSQVSAGKLLLGISAVSENSDSLADKLRIARANRFKGVALWRLGLISEEMWEALQTFK